VLVVVDGCKVSRLGKKAYAGICAHVGGIPLILGSSGLRRGVAIS